MWKLMPLRNRSGAVASLVRFRCNFALHCTRTARKATRNTRKLIWICICFCFFLPAQTFCFFLILQAPNYGCKAAQPAAHPSWIGGIVIRGGFRSGACASRLRTRLKRSEFHGLGGTRSKIAVPNLALPVISTKPPGLLRLPNQVSTFSENHCSRFTSTSSRKRTF